MSSPSILVMNCGKAFLRRKTDRSMRDRQRVCNGSFVPFTIIHTCSKEFLNEEPGFSLPRIRKSHEPNATDDLDPSKLNQHVTRLLDLRGPDHCEPIPGRPEWSLRHQFFCGVRGIAAILVGTGFLVTACLNYKSLL